MMATIAWLPFVKSTAGAEEGKEDFVIP